MRNFLITTAVILTGTAAFAQSALERMEVVGESMAGVMFDAMISEVEASGADVTALRAAVPDMSWDEPMRGAAGCILEKYEAEIGPDGIEAMLLKMEETLPKLQGLNIEEMDALQADLEPEGISMDQSLAINNECGMTDLMMARMMDSQFMTLLMEAMGG